MGKSSTGTNCEGDSFDGHLLEALPFLRSVCYQNKPFTKRSYSSHTKHMDLSFAETVF